MSAELHIENIQIALPVVPIARLLSTVFPCR